MSRNLDFLPNMNMLGLSAYQKTNNKKDVKSLSKISNESGMIPKKSIRPIIINDILNNQDCTLISNIVSDNIISLSLQPAKSRLGGFSCLKL